MISVVVRTVEERAPPEMSLSLGSLHDSPRQNFGLMPRMFGLPDPIKCRLSGLGQKLLRPF